MSRFSELDEALDACLVEFAGDNMYYDKDGNPVKKKPGLLKKAATVVGAATIGAAALRGGGALIGKGFKTKGSALRNAAAAGYRKRLVDTVRKRAAGAVAARGLAGGRQFDSLEGLIEFDSSEDEKKGFPHGRKAAVAGAVGTGALAYSALRKNPKTREKVLRGEVHAENLVRDPKAEVARMKKRYVPKAKEAVRSAVDLKKTQAGNLAHRAAEKVGLGYKGRHKIKQGAKGLKEALVKAVRMRRFESEAEFLEFTERCVELTRKGARLGV